MEISSIKNFLSKYHKLLTDNSDRRQMIIEVISSVSGVALRQGDITFRNEAVYIEGGSVLKNEIFLHKERIIRELQKRGITDIADIR